MTYRHFILIFISHFIFLSLGHAQKIEKVWYLDSVYYKTYKGEDIPADPDVINYFKTCKNQVFLQLGENSKVKIADFLCTLEKKEPAYFEGTWLRKKDIIKVKYYPKCNRIDGKMRWTYQIEELEEQRLVIVLDSYKYLIYYVLYSKD